MSETLDTWRVGLIGHPVRHSVSPSFQQAAFDFCRIAATYELWDTDVAKLGSRIAGLRNRGVLGANVTIPHKQASAQLADERTAEVELTGAANTLVNRSGHLVAHNTDVGGFTRALETELHFAVRGCRVGVLGAGGAARGVVAALAAEKAESAVILNRSFERAQALVAELGSKVRLPLRAAPLDGSAGERLVGCDLIVNCTSVGLVGGPDASRLPVPADNLPAGATVVDIIANPLVTPFLAAAAERGHVTLGGLAMLVQQGALAFELWTGLEAPFEVMMDAARVAMSATPTTDTATAQRQT